MVKKLFILIIALSIMSSFPFSQQRGFKVVAKSEEGEPVNLYTGLHALVIGVSDYLEGWPDLPNAARDADEIGDLFLSLGFQVTRVTDPTKAELIQAIESFVYGPGQEKENCLVIFFAGHGYTVKLAYGDDMGYIIPRDAPDPDRDMSGFKQKAIDMQAVEAYARRIEAKHALFLFDSCFSGALFNITRAKPPAYISDKTARQVRQFITAGGEEETVPDESIFKEQLIEALRGEADRNDDGFITGTELGDFLHEKVVVYSYEGQHPQYGKIRDPNLDKGDFVFQVGGTGMPVETATAVEPTQPGLGYGYLLISSYPATQIEIDGKPYGGVPPLLKVRLPEGKHIVRFVNMELSLERTLEVEVLKDGNKRVHERFDF